MKSIFMLTVGIAALLLIMLTIFIGVQSRPEKIAELSFYRLAKAINRTCKDKVSDTISIYLPQTFKEGGKIMYGREGGPYFKLHYGKYHNKKGFEEFEDLYYFDPAACPKNHLCLIAGAKNFSLSINSNCEVRLKRKPITFSVLNKKQNSLLSNPHFYLISPCYAELNLRYQNFQGKPSVLVTPKLCQKGTYEEKVKDVEEPALKRLWMNREFPNFCYVSSAWLQKMSWVGYDWEEKDAFGKLAIVQKILPFKTRWPYIYKDKPGLKPKEKTQEKCELPA